MEPRFETRLAQTPAEIAAAQALRYAVFVEELGGDGALVDHDACLERDRFDPYFDHLLLLDQARETDKVVGVYRLMRAEGAAAVGWYSAAEFDLTPVLNAGRTLCELGRSCLHADYRGGAGLMHLWQGLAAYVQAHEIEVLFGTASFHGTDVGALAGPLSLLHHRHLAPEPLRARAIGPTAIAMDQIPADQIDRPAALRAVPALIKAYLRLGGFVGQGAWIDHAFNTTDVFLVMDTAQLSAKHRALYTGGAR